METTGIEPVSRKLFKINLQAYSAYFLFDYLDKKQTKALNNLARFSQCFRLSKLKHLSQESNKDTITPRIAY